MLTQAPKIGIRGDEGWIGSRAHARVRRNPDTKGSKPAAGSLFMFMRNNDLVLLPRVVRRRASIGAVAAACGKHAGACDARTSGSNQLRKNDGGSYSWEVQTWLLLRKERRGAPHQVLLFQNS